MNQDNFNNFNIIRSNTDFAADTREMIDQTHGASESKQGPYCFRTPYLEHARYPSPLATCSTTLAILEATGSFCWPQSLIKIVFATKVTLLKRFLNIPISPSHLNRKPIHSLDNDSKMARVERKSLDYSALIQ